MRLLHLVVVISAMLAVGYFVATPVAMSRHLFALVHVAVAKVASR